MITIPQQAFLQTLQALCKTLSWNGCFVLGFEATMMSRQTCDCRSSWSNTAWV